MNDIELVFYRKPTVLNTEPDVIYRMGSFDPDHYDKVFYINTIRVNFDYPSEPKAEDINRMHAFLKELSDLKMNYNHHSSLHCDGTNFTFFIDVITSVLVDKRKFPADFLKRHQELFDKVDVYGSPVPEHHPVDLQRKLRFCVYPQMRAEEELYHNEERTILFSHYLFHELTNAQSKKHLDIL